VTPAGGAISGFIGDRIGGVKGEQPSQPALFGLPPGGGEVLVNSERGPWIVKTDGSRRLLGDYEDASWSPHGLYVVATRGRQLAAVTPEGQVRWSLARADPITMARWSPDGFRIAYRSGDSLRVVNADGSGDRLLAKKTASAAPAWRPGVGHVVAWAQPGGRISIADSDRRKLRWSAPSRGRPLELAWSADGERLAELTPGSVWVYSASGRLIADLALGSGPFPTGVAGEPRFMAFARQGHDLAIVEPPLGDQTDVVLWRADRTGPGRPALQPKPVKRPLFAGPGDITGLAWSPRGSSLLVAWRSADQWLFLRPGGKGIAAVSHIVRQFDPGGGSGSRFPSVSGWCCPP
jgi:dipeptidyl aminopeptidase/acylaminoacyl peptidase